MSKKKTTTKSKPKNRTIIKISAVLLGIIAVAYVVISIVFGAWNPIEWGREKEKNVMTINARTLTEKEYAIYGLTDVPLGAKLLSVEFEPADASDRRIKWAVYFENESILRLKFKTDGKIYNLGAIDNKQSPEGGQKPDNPQDKRTWLDDLFDFFQKIANFFSKLPWWAWLLIIPAAFIVLIIIVMLVIWLIKSGFKLIWRIISAPFRKDKKK